MSQDELPDIKSSINVFQDLSWYSFINSFISVFILFSSSSVNPSLNTSFLLIKSFITFFKISISWSWIISCNVFGVKAEPPKVASEVGLNTS